MATAPPEQDQDDTWIIDAWEAGHLTPFGAHLLAGASHDPKVVEWIHGRGVVN